MIDYKLLSFCCLLLSYKNYDMPIIIIDNVSMIIIDNIFVIAIDDITINSDKIISFIINI